MPSAPNRLLIARSNTCLNPHPQFEPLLKETTDMSPQPEDILEITFDDAVLELAPRAADG